MRKQDTKTSLDERKGILVDPFNTGFDHSGGSFDLNKVRLAFQVFLQVPGQNGKMTSIPVPDIQVSQTIMDRKSFGDLKIENYSDNCAPFEGKPFFIALKNDIQQDPREIAYKGFIYDALLLLVKQNKRHFYYLDAFRLEI